ncbi:BAG family molecular chaperone regulator 7 [Quercus suber]|uniref:Bag family molecular chaperone regulator 7 n=1 Tax=Quercus suber TaxID=58331 RepID=A0AAW0MA92_QUESU
MSRFRRFELIEPCYHSPPSLSIRETSIFAPKTLALPSFLEEDLDLDFLSPSPFEFFDAVTDLVRIDETPSFSSYRRIQKVERHGAESLYLQSLSDRVNKLESRFDRLVKGVDRKYTWTAEIKDGSERKYKWTAEIKDGKKKKEEEVVVKRGGVEKSYKWTAEIKGRGDEGRPITKTYTLKATNGDDEDVDDVDDESDCVKSKKKEEKKKKEKKKKKGESHKRTVEIEELGDHRAVVLRQAFARRAGVVKKCRGKEKELSPQDAALMIQLNFRAYLIRRSKALRALRDLAVAKTKLKEIRALFNNFSYRSRVAQDAGERQRFSEKIIVLLLTVDSIEGVDVMVRAAKRSMVDELEAMLDVVDPQPPGKSLSMRRRTFDMPDGAYHKEIAEGVAQVIQMLDEEKSSETFEVCV